MSYCCPSWVSFIHFYIFSSELKKRKKASKGSYQVTYNLPICLKEKFLRLPICLKENFLIDLLSVMESRCRGLMSSEVWGPHSWTSSFGQAHYREVHWHPLVADFCQDAFCYYPCLVNSKTICSIPNFTPDRLEQLDLNVMITSTLFLLETVSSSIIMFLHT